jgi:N-acyl homoserine lactone hydrolase
MFGWNGNARCARNICRSRSARHWHVIAFAMAVGLIAQMEPAHAGSPQVKLWRMQCGKDQPLPKPMFSDTFLYPEGSTKDFTFSCYLIKHDATYMIWDAGLPDADGPRITAQLEQLGLTSHDIKYLGISHFHFDHIGQAADFPESTLLIGEADFAAVKKGDRLPDNSTDSALRLAPWTVGGKPVQLLTGDFDVFGDGSVVILRMPGHTPGHRSLLVRLAKSGNILISGDLYHFGENRTGKVVPAFNTDRAQTIASMDRFEQIAKRLEARVIIQHDLDDIRKLPVFPAGAE